MKIFAFTNPTTESLPATLLTEVDDRWLALPDSVMLRSGKPVFIPDAFSSCREIPAICYRISRLGKRIEPRFAPRYCTEAAPAIMLMDDNAFADMANDHLPHPGSYIFDGSVVVGDFIAADSLQPAARMHRSSHPLPGYTQTASAIDGDFYLDPAMAFLPRALAAVSHINTVKNGDLILIALTQEPPKAFPDTAVTYSIGQDPLLNFHLK